MVLVDTNILLHAMNTDTPECRRATMALEALANGSEPWALSWGIIYEFLRVATHPRVFPQPLSLQAAHAFVAGLLAQPNCVVLAETALHRSILAESLDDVSRLSGNILHDLHYAVLMREHGVSEILTLDRDYLLFPWITIRKLP